MHTAEEAELLELIRKKAIIYGQRTLASGKVSHYYIDGKQITLDCRGAYLVGRIILERIRQKNPTSVGGPTLGADPIVGAVLSAAGCEGIPLHGFIVRKSVKDHGTSRLIEGPILNYASRVVLVEDVITTGGSVEKAINAVEDCGAQVIQIVSLVDREQGAIERLLPYNYTPLFLKSDLRIQDSKIKN